MALWTDIVEPADLTGYIRAGLEEYEDQQGTLARYLPNREVADTVVRFIKGSAGLVPEAIYRAYDAEIERIPSQSRKRVVLEIPAVGAEEIVSEYEQLRGRNAADEQVERSIFSTGLRVARAIANRVERLRGTVLTTGRATIANLGADDDFGRRGDFTTTAANLWTDPAVSRIAYLQTLFDLYIAENGVEPGAMLVSNRVFRALANGTEFKVNLVGGGSRPATDTDVQAIVTGAGLPPIERYNRRTTAGKVLPDDRLLLLPAAVDPNAFEDTELGSTVWGQTLTSTDERFGLADEEQPGIVAGVYRGEKPPLIAEVIADAIAMPTLANANLSLAAKVL